MAASGADNMQTELSTDDATQPPYQGRTKTPTSLDTTEEKRAKSRRAQRVRTVRLTTQVHPDMLVPYLYGENGGRCINTIVNSTGCTIDYCALSPDEPERSPQSHAYVMNFLVSAGSSETLEEATRQLRKLVERVQVHLQKKVRARSARGREEMEVDDVRHYVEGRGRRGVSPRLAAAASEAAMSKREAIPDEWWNSEDEGWDTPPIQRVYYAPGRVRRERQRYMEVMDEADEKSEFVMNEGRADAAGAEAVYLQQRGQSPSHFVARRRVRRFPDQSRWISRSYPTMYAVASPQGGSEQPQRKRTRQSRHIYQGAPNHFAQRYEFDDSGDEHDAECSGYAETADLTNENAGENEMPEFVEVPEQHQPVHRAHPRRSLKRPLSKMRNDGPPPPIYRQRMPYIYDYSYDDEDDEWMTDDDEMAVAYGYPPQFHPVEIPIVRRRRRFDSVNSQHWSSPAGHGHQHMYKRRRLPRNGSSLEHDTSDDPAFEAPNNGHIIPPSSHRRASFVDQLDEVADNTGSDAYSGRGYSFADRANIPTEDGSTVSSSSDIDTNTAAMDHRTPVNDNVTTESTGQVLTDPKSNSPVRDPMLEQGASIPNDEVLRLAIDKTTADEQPEQHLSSGPTSQSEVMPLDPIVSIQETAGVASSQISTAATSPLTRKTPKSRIASPPSSTANNPPNNVDTTEISSTGKGEPTQVDSMDGEVLVDVPTIFSEVCEQGVGSNNMEPSYPKTEIAAPVDRIVTDTIRINNHVIASLERVNKMETDFVMAKASLSVQEDKLCRLENNTKCNRRLEKLCGIVYNLQCRIGSNSCGMDESRKQELLGKLDSYLENLSNDSEQTLEEKVDALQAGLENLLTTNGLIFVTRVGERKAVASKLDNIPNSKSSMTPPKPIEENHDKTDDTTGVDWEDDGWFEESIPADPASDEDQENFVSQISPKKSNLKFEGDFLAVKLEEGLPPRMPRKLPPFVWSLLVRVISSDPQSYVMRVTHKRLIDEIAKGDPYYYLHQTIMPKDAEVSSLLRSSPSQPCEFGCRGASALKWERKLVSQISSRMKSFDNVAYSLARSSGGKEVLNRKKMNSIIRKLHLVAMQLHSLVSHLYCVKGQATCKEVDSLPIALNNSHFERKMGVYKSRLKLVVPHKYQQQQTQQQQRSLNEPAEELLRDTYEFFPELLLCIDIWGYNYREGQNKRQSSKSVLSGTLASSGVVSEGALFPLGFFRGVESLAFDFEHDSNGLLRCICDELLNIVCLWNDFKWTDNLETVALERVVSFETDVTASILKILELYAHHLQALWAVRLLDEPEQLRSVHFTQFNAYYSDRSQGSLNTTAGSQSRAPRLSKNRDSGSNFDAVVVDKLVANEIAEQRLAEEYWNRKVTALSVHHPEDDAMEVDGPDLKPTQLLSAATICSWDQQTLISYLLRWSDVYAIRSDVNALSAVTNHMLKHEVQKYRFTSHDRYSEPTRGDSSKVVVDLATRQLLAAVSRAQMLIRDALIDTEKLALHSASSQLPDERKHSTNADTEVEAGEAVSGTAQTTNSFVEDTQHCQSAANNAHAQANDTISEPGLPSRSADESTTPNNYAVGVPDEANLDTDRAPEQPELKDLIQLLAVTKQDMQELCGHRPRSARMREKLQTQSLQLARQTVEIFRNMRNMYGSQRR